jgi:hypothetical protein
VEADFVVAAASRPAIDGRSRWAAVAVAMNDRETTKEDVDALAKNAQKNYEMENVAERYANLGLKDRAATWFENAANHENARAGDKIRAAKNLADLGTEYNDRAKTLLQEAVVGLDPNSAHIPTAAKMAAKLGLKDLAVNLIKQYVGRDNVTTSDISFIAHQISTVSSPEYDGIVLALKSVDKPYGSSLNPEELAKLLAVLNKF